MSLCADSLYSHKVSHWSIIFMMPATLVRPYLAKSSRLPRNSSNWNSENIWYDITPCNIHYNLSLQNLTFSKVHKYCISGALSVNLMPGLWVQHSLSLLIYYFYPLQSCTLFLFPRISYLHNTCSFLILLPHHSLLNILVCLGKSTDWLNDCKYNP